MPDYGRLFVNKVLRIHPEKHGLPRQDRVTRGESIVSNYSDTDQFVEHDPSVQEFVSEYIPSRDDVRAYISSLFPL
jgi:hypothetical protein